MPQPEPFPILPTAGLERAARSCPLREGKETAEWIACCSWRFFPLAALIARDDALAKDVLQESWIKVLQEIETHVGGPPACSAKRSPCCPKSTARSWSCASTESFPSSRPPSGSTSPDPMSPSACTAPSPCSRNASTPACNPKTLPVRSGPKNSPRDVISLRRKKFRKKCKAEAVPGVIGVEGQKIMPGFGLAETARKRRMRRSCRPAPEVGRSHSVPRRKETRS